LLVDAEFGEDGLFNTVGQGGDRFELERVADDHGAFGPPQRVGSVLGGLASFRA